MTGVPATTRRAAPVEPVTVTALSASGRTEQRDQVAGEEPLEIRLAGPDSPAAPIAVTMRTPGHDFELAVGFLLAEGLLCDQSDLRTVKYCALEEGEPQEFNVVTVTSARTVGTGPRRRTTVSASCGICGSATLDVLKDRCPSLPTGEKVAAEVLMSLPDRLHRGQRVFTQTGGLHAAGLFDASGSAMAIREDVGRHNAVDKLVGWAAMRKLLPLGGSVLVVSGRVSYEIVQKAAVAGVPTLVAVSAPTSLAVTTAQALGMTLAGFVREGRANLYAGAWRVEGPA
ncbi:MAG: formate dehydrogenase accessory sulfurtransferase FdhD [Actinomycetota bacterium]|nr:formate dehydrogenase accessory sulfurtransferase FdhD [Actinomycetota bacterium]